MIENDWSLSDTASVLGHDAFNTALQAYAHFVIGRHRRHDLMDHIAERLIMSPHPIDATVTHGSLTH